MLKIDFFDGGAGAGAGADLNLAFTSQSGIGGTMEARDEGPVTDFCICDVQQNGRMRKVYCR